jgi:prepilin-type N-terminal cleavage/methylation domain-containing protein
VIASASAASGRSPPDSSAGSRRRERGFTFVEIVFATAILAVAALVAFPTMLSFFELSDAARDENVATHDLMAATEDLLATPFALVTTTYPDGQPIPKFTRLHLPDEQITVRYDDPAADPLLITLTAAWSDSKGRPRQEVYRCVRTR